MSRWWLAPLTLVLVGLHQDTWLWHSVDPIVFGVLPAGLFYHVCYALASAGLMVLLVRFSWPSHLEDGAEHDGEVDGPR